MQTTSMIRPERTGLGDGMALGYELVGRWSPMFWAPLAVFAGTWFAASTYGHWRIARETRPDSSNFSQP